MWNKKGFSGALVLLALCAFSSLIQAEVARNRELLRVQSNSLWNSSKLMAIGPAAAKFHINPGGDASAFSIDTMIVAYSLSDCAILPTEMHMAMGNYTFNVNTNVEANGVGIYNLLTSPGSIQSISVIPQRMPALPFGMTDIFTPQACFNVTCLAALPPGESACTLDNPSQVAQVTLTSAS